MANVRMKIAAGATVLGLGGLAGYALGANDGQPASAKATPASTHQKPKVQTEVVHRTIHVRPKDKGKSMSAAGSPTSPSSAPISSSAPAPVTVAQTPAVAPVSAPSSQPVSTHTSGGGGSNGGNYDDGGESEHESEGGGDD